MAAVLRRTLWVAVATYFAFAFAATGASFVFFGLRVYSLVKRVPVHFKILGRVLREASSACAARAPLRRCIGAAKLF